MAGRVKYFGIVYLVRHRESGKCYVGKTTGTLKRRWNEHCCLTKNRKKSRLHNAIQKYGRDAFDVVELGRAATREELDEMEKRSIRVNGSVSNEHGFNITAGGDGMHSFVFDEATRKRIGEQAKRMWERPGFKEAMSAKRKSFCAKPASKEQLRATVAKFVQTAEYKKQHQMNTARLWQTDEYRAKQASGMRAAMDTPEYKAKISKSARDRWSDPVYRERMCDARKTMWADPQRRAEMLARWHRRRGGV